VETRSLNYFAEACAGRLHGADAPVRRVCSDSRQLQAGDLFVALRGDRFDGHAFARESIRRGAVAAVVETAWVAQCPAADLVGFPRLEVENSRRALGRMAGRYRNDFELPVVAVAGSNGKTTTKTLLGALLNAQFPALVSEGSFNNDIGVPATLLRLERSHQAAVLEAGTNHPGELAPLLALIQPRIGLLTSLGPEHLEFFGGMAGVVAEEGCLAEALPAHGRLIAAESEWLPPILQRARAPVAIVGLGETCDWRAGELQPDGQGTTFTVAGPVPAFNGVWRIGLLGRHQVVNALLALAAAAELGVEPARARPALALCAPPKMRLQPTVVNGVVVINDAYNANAASTTAALETLCGLPCAGRRVAVLGEMGELGGFAADAHAQAGTLAARSGLDCFVTLGPLAELAANAARQAGLAAVYSCASLEEVGQLLRDYLRAGDVLLLKASRAAALERVAGMLDPAPPVAATADTTR
jgi:UDP-N-acetylmuramoyl-tripeptide--D-alanyl-D-alanine ligase